MFPREAATAFLFDVIAVAIFVGVGHLTHGDNTEFFKVTVLPFGLGLLAGWLVGIVRNFQSSSIMFGVMVWGATVFFGIGLRSFFGGDITVLIHRRDRDRPRDPARRLARAVRHAGGTGVRLVRDSLWPHGLTDISRPPRP